MKPADLARLVALAAIWGASFMLMRVITPALGALATSGIRLSIAGGVMCGWFAWRGIDLRWRATWREYGAIGALNAAIPYTLFAFASLHLPAGYSAILNATTPLFAALFSALWLGDRLTWRKGIGLGLGFAGVSMVVRAGPAQLGGAALAAIAACLVATVCYGLASIYLRKRASHIPSVNMSAASQLAAGAMLVPFIPFAPPTGGVTLLVAIDLLVLALVCSALALTLYFRLINDVGPTKALSVTFLIPLFGVMWARVFLGEAITREMVAGGLLILSGIACIALLRTRTP